MGLGSGSGLGLGLGLGLAVEGEPARAGPERDELEQHVGEALGDEAQFRRLEHLTAEIEHAARQLLEAALHLVRVRIGVRVN